MHNRLRQPAISRIEDTVASRIMYRDSRVQDTCLTSQPQNLLHSLKDTKHLPRIPNMALAFLDRDHSIAPAGYSRWLVPPAALAIHLSIGQVYAFSVFKNPLLALHGSRRLRLEPQRGRLHLLHRHRLSRHLRRALRSVARKGRPSPRHVLRRHLLRLRLLHLLLRSEHPSASASSISATASSAASALASATSRRSRRSSSGSPTAPASPPASPSWASAAAP